MHAADVRLRRLACARNARAARGLERAHSIDPIESRIALLFFLTGAVTGAVYWLIAGPRERAAAKTGEA